MRRVFALCILLFLAVFVAGAQESQFDFSFSPRFWGISLGARYSLEPPVEDATETSIITGLSGAYESVGYYRAPDGSLFTDGDDGFTADQVSYNRLDLYWLLGMQQGLVPRSDSADDLAVVFAYYRGRYDLPFSPDDALYFSSGLPETDGGLLGSLHGGFAFSNVVDNDVTAVRSGVQAETVVQWGPGFLHNNVLGSADFIRTTVSAKAFLPLFESLSPAGLNSMSGYLAAFGAFDWASGNDVPMEVRNSIGTRSERPALGGSVRGFESDRFDATLKAVGNVELRVNLPTISFGNWVPDLMPGFLVYTDAGYFNDLDGTSPYAEQGSGVLVSSGGGVYVDVRGVAQIIFYTNGLWNPGTIENAHWVPFTLGFGFHF